MQLRKRHIVGIALVAAAIGMTTGCTRSAEVSRPNYDIATGDRVRVELDDNIVADGWVTSLDDSALHINPGGNESRALHLQSINSVKRYRGKSNHGVGGAVVGALAGTAVGLVVWGRTEGREYTVGLFAPVFGGPEPEEPSPAPVIIGTVVGTALGFLVGHNIRYERWQTVRLKGARFEAKPTPSGGRAGVFWEF